MTRPNILLIMTDQHNPRIAGFAGDPVVQTPHLDHLARRSLRFDTAICPSPCCTPSRMAMLCGKDIHHCSAWNNHWVIFPEHTTWPACFAAHGYRTCLVGKMHFGGADQMQGFQHRPYGDLRHGLGHQPDPIDLFPAYHGATNAGVTEIPESLLQENVTTRETLAWVLEHRSATPDTPWFCCASYSRPHAPYTVPARYLRRYRDRTPELDQPDDGAALRAALDPYSQRHYDAEPGRHLTPDEFQRAREAYYGCVDFVDDCIGDLLDGLERAGALENTIVIYTSDHGDMAGRHGMWGKCVPHDESIRVPLLVSGPGVAAAAVGQGIRQPISLIDLYPTTCALAGIDPPDDLDGIDASALLSGDPAAAPARTGVPSTYLTYAVRVKGAWTLPEDEPACAMRAWREADWTYVDIEGGAPLLFDRVRDPDERVSVAGDPAHAERLARMAAAAADGFDWRAVRDQLDADRERVRDFASGLKPSTPNQYRLPDGRVFDAESALYDARWLHVPPVHGGGIIPQQFG